MLTFVLFFEDATFYKVRDGAQIWQSVYDYSSLIMYMYVPEQIVAWYFFPDKSDLLRTQFLRGQICKSVSQYEQTNKHKSRICNTLWYFTWTIGKKWQNIQNNEKYDHWSYTTSTTCTQKMRKGKDVMSVPVKLLLSARRRCYYRTFL